MEMAEISSSCVFVPVRNEGLMKLQIIPPKESNAIAAAGDTIAFDKSFYGLKTILKAVTIMYDSSSAIVAATTLCTVLGDTVTVTLPSLEAGIDAGNVRFLVEIYGISRATHSSGGTPLFGKEFY
jgi:hypothetical protein